MLAKVGICITVEGQEMTVDVAGLSDLQNSHIKKINIISTLLSNPLFQQRENSPEAQVCSGYEQYLAKI